MYKFVKIKEITKEMKDGKYFTYGKVKETDEEGFKLDGSDIKFLSIFKTNKNDFVRVFFTKDKEDFIVDILQKVDYEKFGEVLEVYEKFKNLYI